MVEQPANLKESTSHRRYLPLDDSDNYPQGFPILNRMRGDPQISGPYRQIRIDSEAGRLRFAGESLDPVSVMDGA